ncbi:FAD-binding dehydrogenase [Leptospira wolffii]|uniref:FAD-binding dehydrogenase n=1 Tax=Leptospira wolffii TaxID=409998 RepID=UPI001083A866|nr:FAD-binding dehydrogenase [Leptospira wolffii]TGL54679.1 FAD-binding dehydrogenase [Leptospira wolffii]
MQKKNQKRDTYVSDTVIIGGGLAGIVAALDLLDANRRVLLVDRDQQERLGGLAKLSFGGIFMVDTPVQRRGGIRDNASLALSDWRATAEFSAKDLLPNLWAENYIHRSKEDIYYYLRRHSVNFFPVVHWVERGLYKPGNSVPRFHMVWGTGHGLIEALVKKLLGHKNRDKLEMVFHTRVKSLIRSGKRVCGCVGIDVKTGRESEFHAEHVVIASGGIAGDLELVRKYWPKHMGKAPDTLLNGSHPFALGDLHVEAKKLGANITHLDKMWNYAAGVHHPDPKMEHHGLSLVPPKSALWLNSYGERIGPQPLITGFDTRFLVEEVCKQGEKYSWQVLNWKIAVKELAVSGSEFNDEIRNKNLMGFLKTVVFGNEKLVKNLTENCVDFVTADSIPRLAEKMNALTGKDSVQPEVLERSVHAYDDMLDRGPVFRDDDQLRRIAQLRAYRGDKIRTCDFQKIVDKKAFPLIAIREFVLTRKSMGGIQTDLKSRVLDQSGKTIPGLYAVGEAAGFGGGGIHGKGALEGTFLGGCILTSRSAVRNILEN